MRIKTKTVLVKWVCSVLLLGSFLLLAAYDEKGAFGQEDAGARAAEGGNLSSQEARKLEEQLAADPDDLPLRTKLLGYYFLRAYESESARRERQKHIVWIIRNHPEAEVAGLPFVYLDPWLDGDSYDQARRLWLEQIESHEDDPAVIGNAANFFFLGDIDLSEELLQKARKLEPENPEWSGRLGRLYALRMTSEPSNLRKAYAARSLAHLESSLVDTTDRLYRFYLLSDLAKTAFEAEQGEKARAYADELIELAPQYRDNWNYGNAVHHGNLILGRLALRSGDRSEAKGYLIQAAKTPGSPQLKSFGPSMTLAKELLREGEKETVIEYLKLCAQFWESGRGQLTKWIDIIETNGEPDFGNNVRY